VRSRVVHVLSVITLYVCVWGVILYLRWYKCRFQELFCHGKSPESGSVDGDTFGSRYELCLACDRDAGILFTAV
jgi:hypothetical protein